MIEREHEELLLQLSHSYRTWYTTKTGRRVKGEGWLPGVNICRLTDVGFNVKNKPYILCEFRREPHQFGHKQNKTTFATATKFFFDYNGFNELCTALGRPIDKRPKDMDANKYVWLIVKKILEPNIGKELKVVISRRKDYQKDDYGDTKQRPVYYDVTEDVYFWEMDMMSFHPIDSDVFVDWDMLYNITKK